MFARGIIVLLCVLVAISDGAREPDCKGDPDVCTAEYKPVCGSNGITYGNECEMCVAIKRSCTQILIQNEGPCENAQKDGAREPGCCKYSSDGCPKIYKPVCGSDGITYDNECMLCAAIKHSCTQILIQNEGPCENAQTDGARAPGCCKYSSVGCPEIYKPVCGSNGITYDNECMLCVAIKRSCTQILIQNEGPCEHAQKDGAREPGCCKYSSDRCLEIYEPVCGSNGITYDNECTLCAAIKHSCTQILIQNEGPCENAQTDGAREPGCCKYSSVGCPEIYKPVCGSNGITYDNECMLCVAIKASGTQILIQNEGPCVSDGKKKNDSA